jgi:hypothetical protein
MKCFADGPHIPEIIHAASGYLHLSLDRLKVENRPTNSFLSQTDKLTRLPNFSHEV